MKYLYLILSSVLFFGCTNAQDLELEITNNEINSLNVKPNEYYNFMREDSIYSKSFKKAKTVVTYKLTNKSNKTYFLNVGAYNKELEENAIKLDKSFISIYDDKGKRVKINNSMPSRMDLTTDQKKFDFLNYNLRYYSSRQNFIIHPNEILYFEWFVVLPFGNIVEETTYQLDLNPNQQYKAELSLSSSSSDASKKYLSRTELKIIEENGYEIFNGTITSKNKAKIKFVK